MRKYWKWIIAAIALLLIGLLAWLLIDYFSVPRLSQAEKEKVKQTYFVNYLGADEDERRYRQYPIIWYEENGYEEEEHVWRYIGTYGDCYAFLVIFDNRDLFGWESELPFGIIGLARTVFYPNEAGVMLYHTQKEFPAKQVFGDDFPYDNMVKMQFLGEIGNRSDWLTDEQFEQLTQDIEKIAAEHD